VGIVRRTVPLLAVAAAVLALVAGSANGASSALRLVKVADGLDAPLFATAPAGEAKRLYVVEQGGLIRVVENGAVRAQPFLDLRAKVQAGGEQGLLGLAFARDYATSRTFVVDYTDRNGDTRVVRYRSDGRNGLPGSAKQLLFVKQPYANHNGGMVAYGPDGYVYVGMGDGGSGGDPENRAQNMSTLLGKIVRLDPRKPAAKPVVVVAGVRNPWRFSFDRKNGDLYVGDVGQGAIEEVDWVKWPWQGLLNFGWDVYEGRAGFEDKALGPGKLVWPVAQYSHDKGCSITGGYAYRGAAVPAAAGRYFYGDYCSGTIWSLRVVAGRATQVRQEPFAVKSLTAFGEDAAGELYLVSQEGTLYRLAG
jgi:glucose/arabinose dehydrogenase